jgi:hypothetical protein
MTKEELEKENEELKKLVERLKEENRDLELRYNLKKMELDIFGGKGLDLTQITKQGK